MIALSQGREESPDSIKHGTLCKQGRVTASLEQQKRVPPMARNETGNPYRLQLIVVICYRL